MEKNEEALKEEIETLIKLNKSHNPDKLTPSNRNLIFTGIVISIGIVLAVIAVVLLV